MTLKRKIAINISIAFSMLYGLSALLIYFSFSSFRKEEFRNRLEEKALTTIKLLFEVKEIDRQMLKIVDQNTINKLYNEKTLVFDVNFHLVYSSIDDAKINWSIDDLKHLKKEHKMFRTINEKEMLGIFYDFEKKNDYYVLIAAEDKYGKTQLAYLLQILAISFLIGTAVVWFSTYAFVKKQLKPLDDFEKDITDITANKLHSHLPQTTTNDEINLLARAFNQMMERIESSFSAQKEFTANASHELRTPVARLSLQLDNLLHRDTHDAETRHYLQNMQADLDQVSDLIDSLLILAKTNENEHGLFRTERVDEIVFEAFAKVKKNFPDFHMNFEIAGNLDAKLEIRGVKPLLEIVFANLFRNAFLYSDDKKAHVVFNESDKNLTIEISNRGQFIPETEQAKLFEPFVRGNNAANVQGSGLGLRIAKRILAYHHADISYRTDEDLHIFSLVFDWGRVDLDN